MVVFLPFYLQAHLSSVPHGSKHAPSTFSFSSWWFLSACGFLKLYVRLLHLWSCQSTWCSPFSSISTSPKRLFFSCLLSWESMFLNSGAGEGRRPPPMVFRVIFRFVQIRWEIVRAGNNHNMRMAEAQSQPFDLSTYDYDPSCPLPSNREARDHVIARGPCQPINGHFPKKNNGRRFLTAWYEKFKWIEYSRRIDKAFWFFCRSFNRHVSSLILSF